MKTGRQLKNLMSTSAFRLIFIVIIVVFPINILTLLLSSTAVEEVERQVSIETKSALDLYMSQIDGAIERITMKMHYLALDDTDFIRLNRKGAADEAEYYDQLQAAVDLKNTLGDILEDNNWVTGVYAYFPETDMQIVGGRYTSYKSGLIAYLEKVAESSDADRLRKWEAVNIDGNEIVVFAAKYKQAYYGAWFELKRLAGTLELKGGETKETVHAFTDSTGQVRWSGMAGLENLELDKASQEYDGRGYVLIDTASKYADLHLVQLLLKSEVSNSLPYMIRILQAASLAALCILPIILISLKKWMLNPMNKLSKAMQKIEEGDMDFRIPEQNEGSEFGKIYRNFNRMMDEVANLKIDVYEQQIEKQQIKMRFLSQQIQPHFILNAMNILYSYEKEEYPLIQKMILCLAKYFRHIVNASADFVELRQEMEHIRNYFEIQQARYPETFFAMVEYDGELADCLLPPLLIQNFAENAIKHSLKIGNRIDIFVIAQKYKENRIRIRLVDTGEGIEDEVAEKVNTFYKTRKYQEGLGVGIQNAIERLDIIYGSDAGFAIGKEKPHGTRVEIILPLRRNREE